MRSRYCSCSDEQPAAILAKSMLRLGISRISDWTGSAVDFVALGLARFCQANGLATASRVFPETCIGLLDEIADLSEYERGQSENVEPSSRLFLMVNYEQAAMVQIGPTLALLGLIHERLPAAFFVVLAENLWRWMTVYDFRVAEDYAKEQMLFLDEEELNESFYPEVQDARPDCLKKLPSYASAVRLLEEVQPHMRDSRVKQLVDACLTMDGIGAHYKRAWPYLLRDRIPEMDNYLEHTDEPGPGALIVFEEEDLLEACFTEQMQYLGQEYAIGSSLMMLLDLALDQESLDKDVKASFDYLGAMVRSLASASRLIEMIRGIYDEDLRQHRSKPGVQAQSSTPGVRGEQL